jgi:heme-degrading monooxygenase HmoA
MECEKCGAEIDEGAEKCQECGEPVAAAVSEQEAFFAEEPAPAADPADVEPVPIADPGEKPTGGGKKPLVAVLVVLLVAALAVGGWFAFQRFGAADSPEAVAKAMLTAYSKYDAQGILDSATHKSLPADGVKEFETQAAEAKKRANGKPGVKDFEVLKVTSDSAEQATVEITGQWLTDPAKGTYTKRTEKLTVVKQDGKWLVKLF